MIFLKNKVSKLIKNNTSNKNFLPLLNGSINYKLLSLEIEEKKYILDTMREHYGEKYFLYREDFIRDLFYLLNSDEDVLLYFFEKNIKECTNKHAYQLMSLFCPGSDNVLLASNTLINNNKVSVLVAYYLNNYKLYNYDNDLECNTKRALNVNNFQITKLLEYEHFVVTVPNELREEPNNDLLYNIISSLYKIGNKASIKIVSMFMNLTLNIDIANTRNMDLIMKMLLLAIEYKAPEYYYTQLGNNIKDKIKYEGDDIVLSKTCFNRLIKTINGLDNSIIVNDVLNALLSLDNKIRDFIILYLTEHCIKTHKCDNLSNYIASNYINAFKDSCMAYMDNDKVLSNPDFNRALYKNTDLDVLVERYGIVKCIEYGFISSKELINNEKYLKEIDDIYNKTLYIGGGK